MNKNDPNSVALAKLSMAPDLAGEPARFPWNLNAIVASDLVVKHEVLGCDLPIKRGMDTQKKRVGY